jgi:phosphoglycolate phosphatase-like HAD superfamily hydrolase
VLRGLAAARRAGVALVLVTGRILAELQAVFPDVTDHFDRVVAEDGAVLAAAGFSRALAASVDDRLRRALRARGVSLRRGEVILAGSTVDAITVEHELERLGLDSQLVRNRGELMIVPAGVSKGRGVLEALAELGISRHDTIAVGDAENDLSLLRSVEVGTAVANAVESVKDAADLVLDAPHGAGVVELLGGAVFAGDQVLHPARWRLTIGHDHAGEAVTVPASRVNVLVSGPAGAGKSFVAGLLVEQLINLAYTVLVVDPEGDYQPLSALPGVVTLGYDDALPDGGRIIEMLHHRFGSVIVDLSTHDRARRELFHHEATPLLRDYRLASGLPHWVLVDEAQDTWGEGGALEHVADPGHKGFLLVSYRPEILTDEVLGEIDVEILLPGSTTAATLPGLDPEVLGELARAGRGHAVLLTDHRATLVTLAPRRTPHVRHWHKYVVGRLPREKQFYFYREPGAATGVTAANLLELDRELYRAGPDVLRHHAVGHDFSRWVREVFSDSGLAEQLATIETQIAAGSPDVLEIETARALLVAAIERNYLS